MYKQKSKKIWMISAVVLALALMTGFTACFASSNLASQPSAQQSGQVASESSSKKEAESSQEKGITEALDEPSDEPSDTAGTGAGQDLGIPISGISETATFYPMEIDGTKLEVIVVKAPDGTIRTAFNTCQVCYDSGRGYYKQDGDMLVCQNCGNRFKMSQVEIESGGCNPWPIFPENKMVNDKNITISYDYLKEAVVIFSNWKTEY